MNHRNMMKELKVQMVKWDHRDQEEDKVNPVNRQRGFSRRYNNARGGGRVDDQEVPVPDDYDSEELAAQKQEEEAEAMEIADEQRADAWEAGLRFLHEAPAQMRRRCYWMRVCLSEEESWKSSNDQSL